MPKTAKAKKKVSKPKTKVVSKAKPTTAKVDFGLYTTLVFGFDTFLLALAVFGIPVI